MSIQACLIAHENDLGLSAVAKAIRNDCRASADAASLSCQKKILVNIFFDGTNNNLERDKKKVANPSQRSHTNVVVLFDACRDDPDNGYYKFYVPGVGTPFPEIGELTESDAGKASGWGGESRIYWAMILVFNAMHRSVANDKLLVPFEVAGNDVKHAPLHISTVTDANYPGQQAYFSPMLKTLKTKLSNITRPKLTEVKLSVFGFSRGAAQARAFCTFMDKLCDKDGTLAGVKLTIQFVGLFDTVASVGLADAAPGFRGFGGYANGTLDIPDRVKRCTHFVAGHEMRKAFPLSSVRSAKKEGYPGNCHEVVYPGAHSDVGGGYGAGSQGKSMQGRSALLSQVPLRHMYAEARTYGVPLLEFSELKAKGLDDTIEDLKLHPALALGFNAYHGLETAAGTVEAMLQNHMDAYRHWRRVACAGPKAQAALSSYQNASPQDREDMASSEREFQLEAYANQLKDGKRSKAEHNLYVQEKVTPPSEAVRIFFDQYVHDSHASFYMVGPVTDEDKHDAIVQARRKVAGANGGTSGMNSFERALAAPGVSVQKFPLMVDFDTQAIANAKGVGTGALAAAISTTRRESGPFIRYRMVYDDSRGAAGKVFSEADDISQEAMA